MHFPRHLSLGLFLAITGRLYADNAAAIELFNQRKYAEAQAAFEEQIATDPKDMAAHRYLGRIAERQQKFEEALNQFETALILAPEEPQCLFEFGRASVTAAGKNGMSLKALSQVNSGRNAMEKAVELAPTNVEFRLGLGEFYLKAPEMAGGSMEKAYEQVDEVRKIDAPRALPLFAALKAKENKYAEASAAWEEVLKTTPDDFTTLYNFGKMAALSGQNLDRGIEALKKCLTLPSRGGIGYGLIHFQLGQISEKKDDLPGAREAYQTSLKLEPSNRQVAEALAKLPPQR